MLRDTTVFTGTRIASATPTAYWGKRSSRSETCRRSVKIGPKSLSTERTCRLGENLLEQLHLRGIGDRSHLEAVSELHRHGLFTSSAGQFASPSPFGFPVLTKLAQ